MCALAQSAVVSWLLVAQVAAASGFEEDTSRPRTLQVEPVPPSVPLVPFGWQDDRGSSRDRSSSDFAAFERSLRPLARTKYDRITQSYERRNAYAQLEAFRHLRILLGFPRLAARLAGGWYYGRSVAFQLSYGREKPSDDVVYDVRVKNMDRKRLRDIRLWVAVERQRGGASERPQEIHVGDLAPGQEFIAGFPLDAKGDGVPLTKVVLAAEADDGSGAQELLGYTYWWGLFL